MTRKPELERDAVEKALLDNNGIIMNAAADLHRVRQTISTFIENNNMQDYLDYCREVRKDRCRAMLMSMAMGEYEIEKVMNDGSIVHFKPGPKYQALETQLKIDSVYTPRQENIETDAKTVTDLEKARDGWKEAE